MVSTELKEALAKGGQHLGDLVWWSLADARVARSTLEALWAAQGLDETLLPEQPDREKALRQACREAGVGLKKDGHEIRAAYEGDDRIVFEMVSFAWDDQAGETIFQQESTLTLDKRNSVAPPLLGGQDTPITQLVQSKYLELLTTHPTGDVGKLLVRTLGSIKAFGLRPTGGVYFAPAQSAQTTRSLRSVVGQLGQSCMEIVPVHESAEATASLGNAAQKSLEKDLAELVVELQKFVQTPPRADTLERRLETFKDLRARADFYKSILSLQVDGLEKGLGEMESIVTNMLSSQEDTTP